MNISAVAATVVVKPPEVPVFKAPDKTPDVQNGAAADGTRTPQPTLLAALPPGQGTRIDQLALTARRPALRHAQRRQVCRKRTRSCRRVNGTRA